jgi:hypothetical protein
LPLANIGFNSGNNSSLGIKAFRTANGTGWYSTSIGLVMDVDDTVGAGGASVWLNAFGNVGIGTATPASKLTVQTPTANYGVTHTDGNIAMGTWVGTGISGTGGWFGTRSNHSLHFFTNDSRTRMTITPAGDVGIGTTDPAALLHVAGAMRVGVLQITGGSDLAEPFEVSEAETIQPGMVVAIDPEQPGRLRLADKSYDRTVAGIVSGANGIKPGLTMKQEGTLANGSLPVALTGRVYCWADASNGPIEPGDLLTTSAIPGHAMKVSDPAKAQGAIIGKAMTGLTKGRGLVLVLVSLQ